MKRRWALPLAYKDKSGLGEPQQKSSVPLTFVCVCIHPGWHKRPSEMDIAKSLVSSGLPGCQAAGELGEGNPPLPFALSSTIKDDAECFQRLSL